MSLSNLMTPLNNYPEPQERTDQLFCYNTAKNQWEYPKVTGDIPSHRAGHATALCGDTVYLFGGYEEDFPEGTGMFFSAFVIIHINEFNSS